MAEETFQRVIPRGMRLRHLLDVDLPVSPSDGSLLLWDAAQGRWVARQITVTLPPHTHPPEDIDPQGEGSGLDADMVDGQHAGSFASRAHTHPPEDIDPQGQGSGLDADMVDGHHASAFASSAHTHPDATPSSAGFMSASDKSKLDGIQAGAEVNQNAFSRVQVGSTVIAATTKTDTLTLASGSNLALTPNTSTKTVTMAVSPQGAGSGLDADMVDGQHASAFAAVSHTHPNATSTAHGFMSSSDKAKLDGIQAGAEVNQNAFSNVRVGTTVIAATTKTDTVELVAGSNVTLTPDVSNKRVTIAATGGGSVNSYGVVRVGTTDVAATAPGDTFRMVAGSNVTLTPNTTNKQVTIAVSPQGPGSGLDADMVDGFHASALQNQNAFSNVGVGTTTIAATTTTDTFRLAAGSNITLSANTSTKTVTINVSPQGPGSNLNADLLDGLDSTAFLRTTGGTITGNLSVTGHVTIGNRPFLFRGKTTSQSIASSSLTVVTWPSAISQTGPGTWDSTNNRYTVSLAGLYLVNVALLLNAVSGGGRVSLRVQHNTTAYIIYDQNINTNDFVLAAGQIILSCAANDIITVLIWTGTARTTTTESSAGTFNRLQIVFLG